MLATRTGTGIGLALICLLILGAMPVISNSRPEGFSALGFAFHLSLWQALFAAPLFLWERRAARRRESGEAPSRPPLRRALTVAGGTGAMFALATFLYVLSIEKAGAVSAAIAIQAYPLFAILWETLFLGRRKTAVEIALTFGLLAALYVLGTGGTLRVEGLSPWFLLALCVPLLWSVAHVIIREELGRLQLTPAQITFHRVSISALFLAVVLLAAEPAAVVSGLTRADFAVAAAIMGFVYCAELIVWFHAMRYIDVSLASSITTPWPALTMILAALFLGDRIEGYQLVAFALVALCIYGLLVAGLRKESAATP